MLADNTKAISFKRLDEGTTDCSLLFGLLRHNTTLQSLSIKSGDLAPAVSVSSKQSLIGLTLIPPLARTIAKWKRTFKAGRFSADQRELIGLEPEASVLGLGSLLRQPCDFQLPSCTDGVQAIEREFRRAVELGSELAEEGLECLHYVLYNRAGSSDKVFHSGLCRDRDEYGVRGDRLNSQGDAWRRSSW